MLADRVCIMSHGKVIALDTPSQIKTNHGVGYTLIVESSRRNESIAWRKQSV